MLRCFFFTSHVRSIRCIEVYFPPIDIRTGLLIAVRTGLIMAVRTGLLIAVRTGQAEPFGSSLFKFSWFIPCHADIINPECADSNADFLIICDKFHVFLQTDANSADCGSPPARKTDTPPRPRLFLSSRSDEIT